MVPMDQPAVALQMLNDFIQGLSAEVFGEDFSEGFEGHPSLGFQFHA